MSIKPPRSLYEKIVDAHTVRTLEGEGQVLLYIDRTVMNEYTSPQAFTGLREAGRAVWSPRSSLMTVDHVNPTAPAGTAAGLACTSAEGLELPELFTAATV